MVYCRPLSCKLRRSSGVLTPLFSVYSENSVGIGEFPDIPLLVDWCRKAGFRVLELLPVNDMGFNFRPYDSESSFALEPMHLCLEKLTDAGIEKFKNEILDLRKKFPLRGDFYDTGVKKAKLDLLRVIFRQKKISTGKNFKKFSGNQKSWLRPYAQYKVLKERFNLAGWTDWPDEFKQRRPESLLRLEKEAAADIEFHEWLQYQLYLQFREAARYAKKNGVQIMGDLPFLVARDSADVWAHPRYFKLGLSAGAPPDLYFADGQEWGMPPYDWEEIERHHYDYVAQKLKYAENFYDFFRVDHFIGVFRVWTFKRGLSYEERRKTAAFDPTDEKVWEEHGRRIVEAMLKSTRMRPCAEDLGCVPECSDRVLERYGIPGIDVQRWMRHWKTTQEFKSPEEYRPNAVAAISTHDTSPLTAWWKWEAGDKEDRQKFWRVIGLPGVYEPEPSVKFIEACFEFINRTSSVFSIQLIQDWLSLSEDFRESRSDLRINVPGTVNEKNWRLRLPLTLENLQKHPVTRKIFLLNKSAGRIG